MKGFRSKTLTALLAGSLFIAGCGINDIGRNPNEKSPNNAPVIISAPIETATVGNWYVYDVKATDADGDDLIYSFGNPLDIPAGLRISETTGEISWRPNEITPGVYEVVVDVYDGTIATQQVYTLTAN